MRKEEGVPIADPDVDWSEPSSNDEFSRCGLLGIELALVLPFLARSRGRRRRASGIR